MWWIVRALVSTLFLLSVVLSIPIAFDVGGRDAGLAFSFALFLYYSAASTIKLVLQLASSEEESDGQKRGGGRGGGAGAGARRRTARGPAAAAAATVSTVLRIAQWFVLPALLIWALSRFSVDAGAANTTHTDWVARTVAHVTGGEGRGHGLADAVGGAFSSSFSSSSSPSSSSWSDWLLGRGGVVESLALGGWDKALRYASPVFQLLEGFCTLLVIQAAGQISRYLVNSGRSDSWVIFLLVFSGSVMASAVYFLSRIARFPQVDNLDAVLIGVTMTSVVFLSAYGIGSGRGNAVESSLLFAYIVLCAPALDDDADAANKLLGCLSWFSASVLIALYTSLLLQHFSGAATEAAPSSTLFGGDPDAGWALRAGEYAGGTLWRWTNVVGVMVLYAVEMYLGSDDLDGALTNHWKME
ncbi:er membrane protein [Niveomyces insectorum RCEF 264]|uniref:Er membrane protein n=1 Tax=Niveomyces insectorum RCEF 264 TaxID=1081102 RepID=A0A167S175_9HYPO|nr:er membrane protein [Niveomyces insectorum RCEF 264]